MTKPLLKVRDLKKYFPVYAGIFRHEVAQVKAVNGISFDIHPGEVVGLVGESGSGKSTVGRCVLRLIEPTGGTVEFNGTHLMNLSLNELVSHRKSMQIVFQDPLSSLNPRKTVGEAISEPLQLHGIGANEQERNNIIIETLRQVGLHEEAIHRYPHQFSGGQQQRICIGRAIALKPKLIILDESLSALDVSIQAQIMNLLMDLKEKMQLSYLFISHDLSIVHHLCDRIVVMYLGKVMEEGPADEVIINPKHPYTQALISSIPARHPRSKKAFLPLKGEIPSPLNPPSGCPFRTRCPFAQKQCSLPPPEKEGKSATHHYYCILD